VADAWAKGKPPADYDLTDAYAGRTRPPAGLGTPENVPDPTASSRVIANGVAARASALPGAVTKATHGFTSAAADYLGRASHALEDFFAHSNFVELGSDLKRGKKTQSEAASQLKTGTFRGYDKMHSLAAKIHSLTHELGANPKMSPVNIETVVALDVLADGMDAIAEKKSSPESHTKMNKDSPEAGPNHQLALFMAAKADRRVFESIHRAMEASLPDVSSQIVYDTYDIVDTIVNVPTPTHPFWYLFKP
jgi:hypothetical protein